MWLNKRKYVLVNIETKEDVYESKELLPKEVVLEDIESENLEDALYRLEERVNGRKVRNTWVMRKARKKPTPEELAAKSREDAEAFIAQDAQDIKDRVEAHRAFAAKVKETYGIESGGGVDTLKIPTGKDGNLGIIEATNLALAESAYEGIRKTRPEEVSAFVTSIMNSGTTIISGIAQMFATKITESKDRKKKPVENKEEPVKKEQPEKKKEKPSLKEPEVHKEDLGKGVTKTTFGTKETLEPSYHYQDIDITSTGSDTPKPYDLYEQYKNDMLGITEEVE